MSEKIENSGCFGFSNAYRPRRFSALWRELPKDWRRLLHQTLERCASNQSPEVFFRADDVGAGGHPFECLCRLFRRHSAPLAMAVVPAWLSGVRTAQLFKSAPVDEPLWGWHQHGWRHVNWQRIGKKSEFGEERPFEKQWRDIQQGKLKMETLFGDRLVGVFTPPWNRLSNSTVRILQSLKFTGVSTAGPLPRAPKSKTTLVNLRIQIDLHTRKAKDPKTDLQALLDELAVALGRKDPVGIMIHHHRMPHSAFEFLDELLAALKNHAGARFLRFNELVGKKNET